MTRVEQAEDGSAVETDTDAYHTQYVIAATKHTTGRLAGIDGVGIVDADETPLTDLGFEALQRRHETLARHRDRCDQLAEQRQAFLQDTTNDGVEVGLRHRRLVPYLYRGFPMDHPLLATVARLDATCAECQQVVRQHLARRA